MVAPPPSFPPLPPPPIVIAYGPVALNVYGVFTKPPAPPPPLPPPPPATTRTSALPSPRVVILNPGLLDDVKI